MTRAHFTVSEAPEPVTEPVAKLGGQPVWLTEPQWPVSMELGKPMWFIGQFPVPGGLAYLFMTEATGYAPYANEPEGGENAVIIQPHGRLTMLRRTVLDDPAPQQVVAQAEGPTVAPDHRLVEVTPTEPGRFQFTGGEPEWLQADDTPGEGYRLIAQLSADSLPFPVNFGDVGVAYAFSSPDGLEGRFLWQCH